MSTTLIADTAHGADAADVRGARYAQDRSRTIPALGCWLVLVAVTIVWGRHLLGVGVRLGIGAPPLAGRYGWRVTPSVLVPVTLGAIAIALAPRITARLSWARLLAIGAASSAAWALALSRIDGGRTFLSPFYKVGYLHTARSIHDPHLFLSHFAERLHSYPDSHTRGHPPGMEIVLWATARLGFEGPGWNAALALAGGAAACVAAIVALRELTGERCARAALPFVALAPGAIWWSSGDPFFAGVSAWAVALVVLATGREGRSSDRLAFAGGVLFGLTAFLSYGLVLVAVIPTVVAVSRRRLRPLGGAALGSMLVFVGFGLAGFSWFAGLAATRTEYWRGAARHRPFRYFAVADLAAFALAVGPAAAVAIARLRDRRVWLLVGGSLAAVAVANFSAMSKAEVERIWLPFVPWVLLATAAFAVDRRPRTSRIWLGVQVASAVLVQTAVRSPW